MENKPRTAQAKLKDDLCALGARVEGVEIEQSLTSYRILALSLVLCLLSLVVLFRVLPRLPR